MAGNSNNHRGAGICSLYVRSSDECTLGYTFVQVAPGTDTAQEVLGRVRVGVDIASVVAVEESIATFGDKYLGRLYTAGERADCQGHPSAAAASLAARFAAKEATLKVLMAGEDVPAWTDIEVRRREDGSCRLRLSGRAEQLAQQRGLSDWSLSLSHEGPTAVAVVIALATPTQS